ncbi:MAG: hypothetical protein ACXWP5_04440 [Bdellovibrionota bacterium]
MKKKAQHLVRKAKTTALEINFKDEAVVVIERAIIFAIALLFALPANP